MANLKTAKQRIKTNERSRQRNMAVKSRLKSYTKAAETAIESGDTAAGEPAVKSAISEIDRAISKGVIHANTGARKKSALERQLAAAAKK
jgi:small subunit ribosomal protein S20